MNLTGLLFVLCIQQLCGYGLLYSYGQWQHKISGYLLAQIMGIGCISFLPFLLQLCYIPLNPFSIGIALTLLALLLNTKRILQFYKGEKVKWTLAPVKLKLYEVPVLVFILFLMALGTWKSYYLPTHVRDMLSGPELIAEYAVREHSLINSVFNINLETTNNYLKPPFITDLQIIYKFFVNDFGGLWLSVLSACFSMWLYSLLRNTIHPLIAAALWLVFYTMPELYSYTYLMLFDYSNMVFFFLAFYFLSCWNISRDDNTLGFVALLMAIAVFIRLESLILVLMILPFLIFHIGRTKKLQWMTGFNAALFLALPLLVYGLWMQVFVPGYIPVKFDAASMLSNNLSHIDLFFKRMADMTLYLLLGKGTWNLWGYFVYLFLLVLLCDLLFYRRYNYISIWMLSGIGLLYFAIPFMGYLIPAFDLLNTTKRALIKLFPFMLIYMANSAALQGLSKRIYSWETKT
jgi:hypothetical protein